MSDVSRKRVFIDVMLMIAAIWIGFFLLVALTGCTMKMHEPCADYSCIMPSKPSTVTRTGCNSGMDIKVEETTNLTHNVVLVHCTCQNKGNK